jgi:hypothetical protein
MKGTILVTGDVLLQENLLVAGSAKVSRADGLDDLILQSSPGGAGRMAELTEAALRHSTGVRIVLQRTVEPPRHAFAVWAPHEVVRGASKNKGVWRIQGVLGSAAPAENNPAQADDDGPRDPDVLLIDDVDLGFRDHVEIWPAALAGQGNPGRIVFHVNGSIGKGALWHRLLTNYADRLTVVLQVGLLREAGSAIAAPLSWDKTIEETVREMESDRFATSLCLARRVVVHFGTDGAASFTRQSLSGRPDEPLSDRVQFERCLYDPVHIEGSWLERRPGLYTDGSRVLAASLARHELEPDAFPLLMALRYGLAAARADHERGGGPVSVSYLELHTILQPKKEALQTYYAAFPQSLLAARSQPGLFQSDLLKDYTGAGLEAVVTKGIDVVLRGPDVALRPVPKATFGKYFTVDREEIERINSIRNLIVSYLGNSGDTRPLSFAVFGPPGSGKSFAVKQLMLDVAGDRANSYDFNLSQFSGPADLHHAFHQVRDASVQNQIPFVFWDEFDTGSLSWLKEFLAPMQDARFYSGGISHAFGKAIFIFAGGTASTLQDFDKGTSDSFRNVKGPDFVSRLRGFINVKGPNPEKSRPSKHPDLAFVIRRAIMLRKNIEKHAARLVDRETGHLAMDAALIRAFLTAEQYIHGARSIESVVSMSNLAHAHHFGAAELPSGDLLRLHVSDDFLKASDDVYLGLEEIETLAKEAHEGWREARRVQGVVYGADRDPGANPPTHNLMVEFDGLPEHKKESNRMTARSTLAALASAGYRLRRAGSGATEAPALHQAAIRDLIRAEHDRWLREVLQAGWAWGPKANPELQLNHNIVPFDQLGPSEMPLDEVAIQAVVGKLRDLGYTLVKEESAANA